MPAESAPNRIKCESTTLEYDPVNLIDPFNSPVLPHRYEFPRGTIHTPWLHGETPMTLFKKFLRDENGATAIEYGLIAAGISVAIIAVVQGLGSKLNTTFTSVQNALN